MDRPRPLPRHRRVLLLLLVSASLMLATSQTSSDPVSDSTSPTAQYMAQTAPAGGELTPAAATPEPTPSPVASPPAAPLATPTVQPEPTAATLAAKLPLVSVAASVPAAESPPPTATGDTTAESTTAASAGDPTATGPAPLAPVMAEDAPADSPNPAPLAIALPDVTVGAPLAITAVVAPPAPLPEPAVAAQTAADRAVAWAFAELGSANPAYSDQMRRYWSGYCEAFVEIAYGTRYRYPSALSDYYAHAAAGLVHRDDDPPAGAFVYYSGGRFGHVALSIGDGEVITTWGNIGQHYTVRRTDLHSFANTYLGWAEGYTQE